MQRLEVSGAVRPLKGSLGVKGLNVCKMNLILSLEYVNNAGFSDRAVFGVGMWSSSVENVGSNPAGGMEVSLF